MILCKSKRAAERVKTSRTKYIEGKFFLKVNKEKTRLRSVPRNTLPFGVYNYFTF